MVDDLAEPFAQQGRVDIVVVDPALAAGVVGRVDVDAFDAPRVARQQGLEGEQVVGVDDEVSGGRGAYRLIVARIFGGGVEKL